MNDLKARLEIIAVRFLLWQKRCLMATMERGYDNWLGKPDVLGMTMTREVIEVEIKISVSDLRANREKSIQKYFMTFPEKGPNYFYYLVPKKISDKALAIAEPHSGIIVMPEDSWDWKVLRKPKKIHSQKVGIKRAADLMRNQSSTVLLLIDKLYHAKRENKILRAEARGGSNGTNDKIQ